MRQFGPRRFAVAGTPTDSVMMALGHLMDGLKPDLILSGVNRGPNMAEDLTYSGTVSAAMEGTLAGIRSIALSQAMARSVEELLGIARLDDLWERGLTDTSADYTLRADGRVQVINRGFDPRARRWRRAHASASPVQGADIGHLQVSFLWPVRASYIVFGIEGDYEHAVVSGHSHDYLWLLSRAPRVRAPVRAALLERARAAGFDVDRLLWVDQRRNAERAEG